MVLMSLKLLGKVAVITGTGGGVGREAASLFAKEGAAVVGSDIDADAAAHTVEMVKCEGGTMASLHPSDLTESAVVHAHLAF
jgi:meso-butanediol dehydrogenase / (S,S)-butanediol dehydrogenase / diacetyl reductase